MNDDKRLEGEVITDDSPNSPFIHEMIITLSGGKDGIPIMVIPKQEENIRTLSFVGVMPNN